MGPVGDIMTVRVGTIEKFNITHNTSIVTSLEHYTYTTTNKQLVFWQRMYCTHPATLICYTHDISESLQKPSNFNYVPAT